MRLITRWDRDFAATALRAAFRLRLTLSSSPSCLRRFDSPAPFGRRYHRKASREDRLCDLIDFQRVFDRLPDEAKQILAARFIDGSTVKETSRQQHRSDRDTCRKQEHALNALYLGLARAGLDLRPPQPDQSPSLVPISASSSSIRPRDTQRHSLKRWRQDAETTTQQQPPAARGVHCCRSYRPAPPSTSTLLPSLTASVGDTSAESSAAPDSTPHRWPSHRSHPEREPEHEARSRAGR